jgi:hypothetical protein
MDTGYRILDTRFRIMDTRYRMQDKNHKPGGCCYLIDSLVLFCLVYRKKQKYRYRDRQYDMQVNIIYGQANLEEDIF